MQTAKEGLGLSHVYLIPARVSPFKQAQTPAVSAEDRLAMCRLAAAEVPDCSVDACELEQARVSYTIYTVQEFHRRFPEAELVLLLGSDMFLQFQNWHRWQEILELAALGVVSREKDDQQALLAQQQFLLQYGKNFCLPCRSLHHIFYKNSGKHQKSQRFFLLFAAKSSTIYSMSSIVPVGRNDGGSILR